MAMANLIRYAKIQRRMDRYGQTDAIIRRYDDASIHKVDKCCYVIRLRYGYGEIVLIYRFILNKFGSNIQYGYGKFVVLIYHSIVNTFVRIESSV